MVNTLYNIIFGVNPSADDLLAMLGLTREDCGRFRDCYVHRGSGDKLFVLVLTRNGAGNRNDPELAKANRRMRRCPYYVIEYDEAFDGTYASFVFDVLARPTLEALVSRHPASLPEPVAARFPAFLERMRTTPDDPEVQRVKEAMRPAMDQLTAIFAKGGRVAGLLDGDAGDTGPNIVKL